MKKTLIPVILFLLMQFLFSNTEKELNILILHSYHSNYEWSNNINESIKETFTDYNINFNLKSEYLDLSKKSTDKEYMLLFNLLSHKYSEINFDYLIVSDNYALNFLLKFRNKFQPNTRVIFCGINKFNDKLLKDYTNITGVVEELSIEETVDIMLKLNPNQEKVFIWGLKHKNSLVSYEKSLNIIKKFNSNIQIINNLGLGYKKGLKEIKKLNKNSSILLLTTLRDENKKLINVKKIANDISILSKAPFYSFWDFYLGFGLTGGKLVNGHNQGKTCVEIIVKNISGEKFDNIKIIKKSPNKYMFDNFYLEKYKLRKKFLPKNAIIINKNKTIYEKYPKITTSIITILIILISTCIIIILRKVSENKTLLRKRLEKESTLNYVLDATSDAIWDLNLKNNVINFSNKFNEMFNIDKNIDQMDINDWYYRISDCCNEQLKREINNLIDKKTNKFELMVKSNDKDIKYILVRATVVEYINNIPSRVIGSNMDFTNFKILENKLTELNNSKDKFFMILAHDMKNIFHPLINIPKSIITAYNDMDSLMIIEGLTFIEKTTKRLYNFLNSMLYWGKSQFKSSSIKKETIEIESFVKNVIELLKINIAEKDLKIDLDIRIKTLVSDKDIFNLVLRNLLSNAIKFSHNEKTISISTFILDDKIILKVTDLGVGIKKEKINQLFKIDSKVTTRGTNNESGSGLGLIIIKEYLEKCNSKIWVESELGIGTSFYVSFDKVM